ncbi:MAG: MurR/RpiR family transcriptional regulator [Lachnospiraceae bacterium]|nr:MurR/RpiR family transcriptional regulator [Lachnospiraceae bacterium]
MGNPDLLKVIENEYTSFSKSQKKIADYIEAHYDKIIHMTAAKLGKEAGVSEATAVRFAVRMGFKGYPEFQSALTEAVKNRINSIQRIGIAEGQASSDSILYKVLKNDYDNIKKTRETIDVEAFNAASGMLSGAERIFIIAGRSCASLAGFAGYYLNYIFDDVRVVGENSLPGLLEEVRGVRAGDVVLGISFPRYSMDTVSVLEFAHKQGASIIALTDSAVSPLCSIADVKLFAKSDMASFADSFAAPLSVINALIADISMRHKERIVKTMEKLEEIWSEFDVYGRRRQEDKAHE